MAIRVSVVSRVWACVSRGRGEGGAGREDLQDAMEWVDQYDDSKNSPYGKPRLTVEKIGIPWPTVSSSVLSSVSGVVCVAGVEAQEDAGDADQNAGDADQMTTPSKRHREHAMPESAPSKRRL